MIIRQYPAIESLNKALAHFICDRIEQTLAKNDRYTMALSGGNTPKSLYALIAKDYKSKIDWHRIHIFFDDERYVPFTDERSNAKMVFESLINEVNIPTNQVHIMRTDIPPGESADAYENILHAYFDGQPQTFDMVLLGMGDDGHTLSLFPYTPVVQERDKWVKEVLLDDAGNYRITLTAPVVNMADTVIFVVTGKGKASTLKAVIKGLYQPDTLPSQTIQPASKNLYWFIDDAAAAELPVA